MNAENSAAHLRIIRWKRTFDKEAILDYLKMN